MSPPLVLPLWQSLRRLLPRFPGGASVFPPPSLRYNFSSSLSSCEVHNDSSISEDSPPLPSTDAAQVLRRWGCTHSEAAFILDRQPFLSRMNPNSLDAKLQLLDGLGVVGSDLVKLVVSCPRFLAGRVRGDVRNRLDFLRTLLPSNTDLLRLIVRNPSILNYDVDRTVRPCVRLYESVGVSAIDLGRLLLSRPTLISRSSLDSDKLELLRRTPVRRDSNLYKHAVAVLAVSRLETLQTKITNLERFGIEGDEVMALFARNPNVFLVSTEKVERNMIYLTGIAKIPSNAILRYPLLVLCNLDTVLRPRYMLGEKMEEMGLQPQMKMKEPASLFRALKMKEARFLEVFVRCHPEDVAGRLMEYYSTCKAITRLAESSKAERKKTFYY